MRARGTVALLVAFALLIAFLLPLDRATTAAQQLALSLVAWGFLVAALALQSTAIRVQVIVLVIVATVLECIGSLVWGAYTYRLENLPLYVPAGPGLFYLSALRAASLPLLQRHARGIVIAVTAGAAAWVALGLRPHPPPHPPRVVTPAGLFPFLP